MNVYKFGGASVASAERIKNVVKIIQKEENKPLLVVISAMGKTTNALEALLASSRSEDDFDALFDELVKSHKEIIRDLFGNEEKENILDDIWVKLYRNLEEYKSSEYDFAYDQIVSFLGY